MQSDWRDRSVALPEIPGVRGLEALGHGGMGDVYRGRDALGRAVAVKVSRRMSKAALARFEREAQLLARFRAPEVVTAHAWGVTDDLAYLVTELVDGHTLDRAAAGRPLAERLELLRAIARAVAVAHRQGVVHRDLKPTNVLVTAEGQVRLIDFGVSIGLDQERLTQTGGAVGTPVYMPPEQLAGRCDPDPTQDVWALGVIAYELFAGRLPFPGDTLMTLVAAQKQGPPPLGEDVPAWLREVVRRALRSSPHERYPDALALGLALAQDRAAPPRRAVPPWLGVAATALFVGCLALGAYAATREPPAAPPRPEAPPRRAAAPDPTPATPDAAPTWPVPWEGQVSAEERSQLARVHGLNAEEHLELLESLASRGVRKACRLYGLVRLVGVDTEHDLAEGYRMLICAVRAGDRAAASELAPLFLDPRTPDIVVSHYPAMIAELGLSEDLELSAALALVARPALDPDRARHSAAFFAARDVEFPVSEEAAYALIQRRLEPALTGGR
ncbi:MAG: serine/threonine-protein kinase [Planctomycetota bacterium]